jgi:superfamily II DNA/RNA helicase
LAKLNFKETVKIDPEFRTPLSEMNFSEKTKEVLRSKGFEAMTPVQSQAYSYVASGQKNIHRSQIKKKDEINKLFVLKE